MSGEVVEIGGLVTPADESYYYDRADHLWARLEAPNRVRVGLSAFGQKAAGAVGYVKMKPAGKPVKKTRAFGSLEAGKYIGPLKSPVDGTLLEVNPRIAERAGVVNDDPYGDGWFVVIEADDAARDLADLVHGEADIREWITAEHARYVAEGLFTD